MKFSLLTLPIIPAFLILCLESKAQFLHPHEIAALLKQPDNSNITAKLSEKGFAHSELSFTNHLRETHENWYFNPMHLSGEKPNAIVTTITDSSRSLTIQYVLYNPYHYKQFMENLLKEKYKYCGVSVHGPNTENIFKKDKNTFLISTLFAPDGNPFYQIMIQ